MFLVPKHLCFHQNCLSDSWIASETSPCPHRSIRPCLTISKNIAKLMIMWLASCAVVRKEPAFELLLLSFFILFSTKLFASISILTTQCNKYAYLFRRGWKCAPNILKISHLPLSIMAIRVRPFGTTLMIYNMTEQLLVQTSPNRV